MLAPSSSSSPALARIAAPVAALIATLAGCADPCDPARHYLPVGAATTADFGGFCVFTQATDWATAGGVKHWAIDQHLFKRCGPRPDPGDCHAACVTLAQNEGVADVTAACAHVALEDFLYQPAGSSCHYLQTCDRDDYPMPASTPPQPGPLYCATQVDAPTFCGSEPGGLWWKDKDFGCGARSPTTPCGFPVYGVDPGADPDEACRAHCRDILHAFTDVEPAGDNTNCDALVHAEVCEANVAPGFGRRFTWRTTTGDQPAPLTCTGACCDDLGYAACANLAAAQVVTAVARAAAPLVLPVRLESNGVVSTGTVTGTLRYSAGTCAAGTTCPLYVESIQLGAPGTLRGVWVDAAGARRTVTVDQLAIRATHPALGGVRAVPGGARALQLGAGTLAFEVRARVDAASAGGAAASIAVVAANAHVITGTLSSASATLGTSLDLAPGVRLILGTPTAP